jgi:hypothetical protein
MGERLSMLEEFSSRPLDFVRRNLRKLENPIEGGNDITYAHVRLG